MSDPITLPAIEAGAPHPGHSDEKAKQILDGAREIFLREGFDGASMNDIARAAGVSKGTLYVYFQSKDQLFAELIRHDKRQQAERMCLWLDGEIEGDAREVLTELARRLLTKLTDPYNVAQVRTVMAVAPKFPEIGRTFWETGPEYGTRRLAAILDRLVARGELAIADTRVAATLFLQMCQGDVFRKLMFCVVDTADAAEIEAAVETAVEVFSTAFAPRG
ncbi:MAG: TetR/AcrR family transcriptional regulator [Phyllobacteriaceae bacterium]|nr:TetR/AcrR family transcriptional regulator [Phyllobacteriaceae bacterium]